jgi:exodeoxyribonuclease V alpha subunit
VTAVVYRNSENGYCVLRFEQEDGGTKNQITVVGTLPELSPGESLELSGSWISHPTYGQQFSAETCRRRAPSGETGIFRYLSSGAIRGIGPALAREIFVRFGEEALRVIEENPERLSEIRGISPKHAREIGIEFRKTAHLRRLTEYLAEFGVSPVAASRIYADFGSAAIDTVRENPYIAAMPKYGAAFSQADALARALGFSFDAPERLEAAVVFEIRHNLGNGHVFLPADKLIPATAAFVSTEDESADPDVISDALDILADTDVISRDLVAGIDAVYLPEYFEAETFVAARLREMRRDCRVLERAQIDEILASIESAEGVEYAGKQRSAVYAAAESRVMALTGGPGTGKTTTVRAILALYDKLGYKTLLCAPTGRAAKRMGELTGRRDAMTIHRALGATPGENGELSYERNETNPLSVDAVIVDEASMLDIILARGLIGALPEACRLILVGDANQLPSVGPGNVFSDIIRSGAIPTTVLDEIFRQARESGIVRAAHSINAGEIPDMKNLGRDIFFMKRTTSAAIAETVAELVARRLPENMKIAPERIQVLTPSRRGDAGTAGQNARLQAALNPKAPRKRERDFGGFTFREGDRVMQTRNNYDIPWFGTDGSSGAGVFNGDLGVIASIDLGENTVTVAFEDRTVAYGFDQLTDLEPAYAMTVHKSQGSEFAAVVLAIPPGISRLAVRSVLYTAITRARELLVIVGDPDVFNAMVQNDRRTRRYSALRLRLAEDSK